MMRLCCQSRPLCSLVAKPAHAAAAAAARRIGVTPKASATATCSIATQATGIDPGIVPGTFPPTTPGGGVDQPLSPGIDPAPGPAPPDMPGGVDPGKNPGAPPGPSIIPGRKPPPPGIDTPGMPGPVPGIDPAPGINPGDLGNMSTGPALWMPAAFTPSSSHSPGRWIMLGAGMPLTVSMPLSLRGYSNAAGGASSKPEVDPEAGDARPDASGPPSGQPGAQPEASGLPSGQPGDLADAEEPLVGKSRTAGPEEMGDAPSKVSEKPEVGGMANPDRVPFYGS